LRPTRRTDVELNPMTPDEVSSFEFMRTLFDERVDKILQPPSSNSDVMKVDSFRMRDKKRVELLSFESQTLTNTFRREIDSAARRIHTLIGKSGRQGVDVDKIQENFSFENSVLLEALKKLEKMKRIEWLDDSRVILSENMAKISGSTYDVYVEKIGHG